MFVTASDIKKKIKELDDAYTDENNTIPYVVDLLSEYARFNGYTTGFSTIDGPIIDFLQAGSIDLYILTCRYEMDPVQAKSFKLEMERHFKDVVRWISEM